MDRRDFIKAGAAAAGATILATLNPNSDPLGDILLNKDASQAVLSVEYIKQEKQGPPSLELFLAEIDHQVAAKILIKNVIPDQKDNMLWVTVSDSADTDVFYYLAICPVKEGEDIKILLQNDIKSVRGGEILHLRTGKPYNVAIYQAPFTKEDPKFDHLPILQGSFSLP